MKATHEGVVGHDGKTCDALGCWCRAQPAADTIAKPQGFPTSNQEVGATRYKLTTGHSDDAGLGGEGWVVRMSDHYPSFDAAQKWVKAEAYEALRLRFEKACARVTELESRGETTTEHTCGTPDAMCDVDCMARAYRDEEDTALLPLSVEDWVDERLENSIRIAMTKTGEDRASWIEDLRYWRLIRERLAKKVSAPLTKCPYCKAPADSGGGIWHVAGCAGLEKVDINRLEYERLVPQVKTTCFDPRTGIKKEAQ
jgi:hypothetical protein